jgi:hypothetical protein
MVAAAWDNVTLATIQHCWQHSQILPISVDIEMKENERKDDIKEQVEMMYDTHYYIHFTPDMYTCMMYIYMQKYML